MTSKIFQDFSHGLQISSAYVFFGINPLYSSRIIPDMVVNLNEDLPDFNHARVADTRVICDFKTVGLSREYRATVAKGHRLSSVANCLEAVNMRAAKVPEQYRDKVKKLDRALGVPVGEKGPVETRLDSFTPVYGLVVGPFCEVSSDIRRLLQPAVAKIAEKRQGTLSVFNGSRSQTAAVIYNAIRRRIGLMMHVQWFLIMSQSMKHVGQGVLHPVEEFNVIEAALEVSAEPSLGGVRADGELGL
jgi:hypothetical protein